MLEAYIVHIYIVIAMCISLLCHVLVYMPIVNYAKTLGIPNVYTSKGIFAHMYTFTANTIQAPLILLVLLVPSMRVIYIKKLAEIITRETK